MSELLKLRIAMAHYHVVSYPKPKDNPDACEICGLDLRNPIHSYRHIDRQRKYGSKVATIIANRPSNL